MKDDDKSKNQLIEELEALRQKVAELERISESSRSDELSKQERLFLALIRQAPFSEWASKGKLGNYEVVLWNTGAEKIYGYSAKEAIGNNYLTLFVSEEERKQSAIDCESILTGGTVIRNTIAEDKASDGTRRTLLTTCFRIWDDEEGEYLQAEIGLDVSELERIKEHNHSLQEIALKQEADIARLKLLEKLREVTYLITSNIQEEKGLEQVLQQIIESVSDLIGHNANPTIYLFDEKHRNRWITYRSSKANNLQSSVFDDLVKARLAFFTTYKKEALFIDEKHPLPAELSDVGELILKGQEQLIAVLPLIFSGKTVGVLFVDLQKHYEFFEELEEILKLFAEQSAIAVETARLMESLRELNQQIADQQELVTRSIIASDFVHRMNNLAGTIRIRIDLLREYLFPADPRDERIGKLLDSIANDTTNLLQATDELTREPEEQNIDINLMLSAMLRNIDIQYPRLISVKGNLSPDLHLVRATYAQLANSIWNVITNAVEAMSNRGGNLTVNASNYTQEMKEWVKIEVKDTGGGLPTDNGKKVFSLSYTTKGFGHGYGLWRTKNLIDNLGGSITFESEANVGTKFIILLPAVPVREDIAVTS